MALTYLDSQMIEIPAAIADLSAQNLQVNNLTATNFRTLAFGNAQEWNSVYSTVVSNSASWEETEDITAVTTTVADNSGKWESVYSNANVLSAGWLSTEETVNALSSIWNSVYDTTLTLSGNWESVYSTVSTLSTAWEESADIVPTVLEYLSANNVLVKDITLSEAGSLIFNSAEIFGNIVIHGSLSALSGSQIYQNITTVTSSLSVENYGPGPGLYVFQDTSLESIAQIRGSDGVDILTINNVSLDQGQDGVKIFFTGSGNTFVVGNSASATAFVVTSSGNINTTGQILSGDTPLHNIFLTSQTDSQSLIYDEVTYDLSISNGNVVNLSSINTTVVNNSAKWEDVYSTVQLLSTDWEESAEVLPTVTNYLSTELVTISSLNVTEQLLSAGTNLFNIFLTQETESQTLTYDELTYDLSISNGNVVNLSSINTAVVNNSAKWEEVYSTVQSLSSDWEESADILPTVTNYLSTELVTVSSISAIDTIITTNFTLLSTEQTPTLSTDPGVKGTFKWNSNYLYICIETDTWKRVALSGWEG